MYPTLRENQAWAQSAAENPASSRRGSRSSDALLQMNGHGTHHHSSSSASSIYARGRPISNGYASAYYNAVYYPNHRVHEDKPPSSINVHQITHLFYAFAACDFDGTVRLSDDKADVLNDVDGVAGGLQACIALKRQNPNLRVILSVGGAKGSEAFKYVATNKALRAVFGQSLRGLVIRYGLDGIDIDWQTPQDATEGSDLISLLATTKGYLPNQHIWVTLPGDQNVLRLIEIDQLPFVCDFINLRTYDFTSGETAQSCHHAQLFASTLPGASTNSLSCQSAVNYLDACKFPLRRVLLGVPCYGRGFVGATGPGQPYSETKEIPYSELPPEGVQDNVDTMVGAAHCTDATAWISYDCPETVRNKATFVKMRRLAGLFYWEVTSDKRGGESLVWTGYDSLRSAS